MAIDTVENHHNRRVCRKVRVAVAVPPPVESNGTSVATFELLAAIAALQDYSSDDLGSGLGAVPTSTTKRDRTKEAKNGLRSKEPNRTSNHSLRIREDQPRRRSVWILKTLAMLLDEGKKLAFLVRVELGRLANVSKIVPEASRRSRQEGSETHSQ